MAIVSSEGFREEADAIEDALKHATKWADEHPSKEDPPQ
jgi:hypothetical protein